MVNQCLAPPGYTCSPYDGSITICPEKFYCQGGSIPAIPCPVNTWSPMASYSLDMCTDNTNVFAVAVVVFFMVFLGIFLCGWYESFGWDSRRGLLNVVQPNYSSFDPPPQRAPTYVYVTPPAQNYV